MASVGNLVVEIDTRKLVDVLQEMEARLAPAVAARAPGIATLVATAAAAAGTTRRLTRRALLFPLAGKGRR